MAEACVGIGQRDVECSDGDTRFSLGAAILGHHDGRKFTKMSFHKCENDVFILAVISIVVVYHSNH